MNVTSYLELYLSLFGWFMYGGIWDILLATGIAFLPFILKTAVKLTPTPIIKA